MPDRDDAGRRLDLTGPLTGKHGFRACAMDRRFSYCDYVPSTYTAATAEKFRILVVVHGSDRNPEATRDLYTDLADELGLILLSPLFPTRVTARDEYHNYIWLRFDDIRYDLILLAMMEELAETYGVAANRVAMTGFSGGGQFVHRFLYVHPDRLIAASIGAPGMITMLDPGRDWFVGTRDIRAVLDREVDLDGMRRVPVHIVAGGDDTDPGVQVEPGSTLYRPGINDSGTTRLERARTLHAELVRHGVRAEFDVVPGAGHGAGQVYLAVASFFRRTL